jgi:hypothetical protein
MNGRRLAVVAAVTVDEEWWPSVVCWVRFEVVGDLGRAPNDWVECSCGQTRQAGASVSRATQVRIQRFGAPEYDSKDKSIRIWSSKALIVPNRAATVFVLELLF